MPAHCAAPQLHASYWREVRHDTHAMRASKMRLASSKSARVATDGGRSASSSAGTQQGSTRMSPQLQGAVATVVLLGTVVLLMSSSLSQSAALEAPSPLRRPALSAAPPAADLEPPQPQPQPQPQLQLARAEQGSTVAQPRDGGATQDVTMTSGVPSHGTSTELRGRVEVEATTGQVKPPPRRISSGHACAPTPLGAGRLAWAAIRNR